MNDRRTLTPNPFPLSARDRRLLAASPRTGGQGGEGGRWPTAPCALVIGLGNPLRGDDGVGPAVIDILQHRAPEGVSLRESAGHDLAQWLASDEFERIVVVDAADLGRPAGSWERLSAEDLGRSLAARPTHGMGLVDSIGLLTAVGLRLPPLSIYAVQPAAVGWGPGLSREVRRAVAAVAQAVLGDLDGGRTVLPRDKDVRCLPQAGKAA